MLAILKNSLNLIGKKVPRAILVLVGLALALAAVELLIAVALQCLLKALGLSVNEIRFLGDSVSWGDSITSVVFMLLALGICRSIIFYCSSFLRFVVGETVRCRVRSLTSFELLGTDRQLALPPSKVNTFFGPIAYGSSEFYLQLSWGLECLVTASVLVVVMSMISLPEAAFAMASLLVIGGFAVVLNRRSRLLQSRIPHLTSELARHFELVNNNWLYLKLLKREGFALKTLLSEIGSLAHSSIRGLRVGAFVAQFAGMLGIVSIVSLLFLSHYYWGTAPEKLFSVLYLFVRVVQLLTIVSACAGLLFHYRPMLKEAEDLYAGLGLIEQQRFERQLEEPASSNEDSSARDVVVMGATAAPAISVQKIRYAFSGASPLFSDLSLQIGAGKIFGISGESGKGKSSLLALLLGFYRPLEGEIQIDALAPSEFVRRHSASVAYVGAVPFLIAGSISDNLCFGHRRSFTLDEQRSVLEQVGLWEQISILPFGLNAKIDEAGGGLSQGQKQRLCLARALIGGPVLLILDEVSANLDSASELRVAEAIVALRGKCTVVLVSHREALLNICDQQIQL